MTSRPALLLLMSAGLAVQPGRPSPDAMAFATRPWRRINSLAGFPGEVRKELGFIANPWEEADLTCIHRPNTPTRQLVFGGQSGQLFFVHYIQGMGIVSVGKVILFQRDPDGTAKKLHEWDTGVASRLAELTLMAKRGEFDSR